ncbi:RIP metalloprotease RseP [bacterium]|nr:RIP metalloprotease RseP [bacterium]
MEVLAEMNLDGMLEYVLGVAGAVLGLGLVIFLHELGHFAVAKWCNVYVERFSIGFGPIILSWKWGETEYALSAIPFGGYVKMLGQDDADPSQMTNEEIAADPRSYIAKNVWQRMAIISAGVTMNVITAVIFYAIAFGIGTESVPAVVGTIRPGMPAWVAGLQRGDQITELNGRDIANYQDLQLNVSVSSGAVELKGYHNDGTELQVLIEPSTAGTRPQIGVIPSNSLQLIESHHGLESPVEAGTAASSAKPPFSWGDTVKAVNGTPVAAFAEFQDLLAKSGSEGATVTVNRLGSTDDVEISVGADHFHTLGLRLDAGPITAIQDGSPAARAGLQVGDKLAKVNGRGIGLDLDPLKLPNELSALQGQEVELVFIRQNPTGGREELTAKLTPEARPPWLEYPQAEGEPMTVASIGAAMHIVPFVLQVDPESPAAQAGIQHNSEIQKVELLLPEGVTKDGLGDAPVSISLYDKNDPAKSNNWTYAFWKMQEAPERAVRLTVMEKDLKGPKVVDLKTTADSTWLLPTNGMIFQILRQEEKADSAPQAVEMAWNRSRSTIVSIYLTLRSLVTQRLSYKELHGPLGIAQAAFESSRMGIVPLLFFLGFLSLNLAVLNFLPIPVLDGGHMVFLIWEAVTRKRPSEKVFIGAQFVGMAFLLGLMALVLALDLSRLL